MLVVASCSILSSQAFVITTRPGSTARPATSLASWNKFVHRFDTIQSAGYKRSCDEDANNDPSSVVKTAGFSIKQMINPKTVLALFLLTGLKWKRCLQNPVYWFAMAFCIKWYRARYVFKIPVWDRQPNWNNVITSKEQEKDLKAYTCKKCGSTLFVAKTREFFFEGRTGIGGLGCFTCGAKGSDNFIMDRDRIVEDVADIDDYFEYERPLDFVSRAEKRELLKLTQGDEEKANQILLDRANAASGAASTNAVDAEIVESSAPEEETIEPESEPEEEPSSLEARQTDAEVDDTVHDIEEESKVTESDAIKEETITADVPTPAVETKPVDKVPEIKEKKPKAASKPLRPPPVNEDFDLSELDMDL